MQLKHCILLQISLLFSYSGEPTNEEKLILALGLGSTGQDINLDINCRRRRSKRPINETYINIYNTTFTKPSNNNNLVFLKPCRRKRSPCEKKQVCSRLIFGMCMISAAALRALHILNSLAIVT